ncbi:MAG: AMP-binding protein [Pirellulales bacterium]|nr:AMP-binding protein [Pirellulales bacterium]
MLDPDSEPWNIRSARTGIVWPALPAGTGSAALALLFQLEQSQWCPAGELRRRQRSQLQAVLAHAYETVEFYHAWFDELRIDPATAAEPETFERLPVLQRRQLQLAGELLKSSRVPPDHGRTTVRVTGGSTGEPVRVEATQWNGLLWRAFTLRDHLWHRRDFNASLAVIRFTDAEATMPPRGQATNNWGAATEGLVATGPAHVLHIKSTTDEQAAWLAERQPEYLLTYPTVVLALARYCRRRGIRLTRLREVRTFGEVLEPEVREACREVWQVPVVDAYSSEEFGYLALQCPAHEHYHVQAENVWLEVLDDAGRPCGPGEVGRVVVTGLHHFAMPLVRYDIGDYAEVGEECPCGRGLPVLRRILGRQRNMLVLPDGRTRWPMIEVRDIAQAFVELPPIAQYQLTQCSLEELELRLVSLRELTPEEEAALTGYLHRGLGYPFRVRYRYVDEIPRSPRGKHEEFRSEVASRNL